MERAYPRLGENEALHIDPVAALHEMQAIYRSFTTTEAEERMHILDGLMQDFRSEDMHLSLVIGGSLAYGQSIPTSDLDITIMMVNGESILPDEAEGRVIEAFAHTGRQVSLDEGVNTYMFSNDLQEWIDNRLGGEIESRRFDYGMDRDFQDLHAALGVPHLIFSSSDESPSTIVATTYEKHPQLPRLSPKSIITQYWDYYKRSFGKYKKRMIQHPEFVTLSKERQQAYVGRLGILQQHIDADVRVIGYRD